MHHVVKGLMLSALLALPPVHSLAAPSANGDAAAYPDKPVTLVVPFPPGGTSDVVGRQLAQQLSEVLDGSFVVNNRAGAATLIGATYVARAPKDGYTLLLSSGSTFTTTPHLMTQMPYTLDDFEPVATIATVPFAFVVKKDLPARTLDEYVAYAKAHPRKINNATNGPGSMVHLLGEVVASGLEVQVTQVHYKGAAPATMDMIGGVVDSNVEALTSALPNLQADKYRALAVLSAERQPLLPDVPTFRELGYPSIVGETWYGVFAPAGTPEPIIQKLNAALREVTASQRFADAMQKTGNQPRPSTPAELKEVTLRESQRWGELIKQLGIKPVQ
ncbi:Bug family tripartite tricarboxylate transporter substrate binding protein [Bordetella petrii]|uniref:Bug family tripartite tricarboxylate transporter substrate binding protein n=1 Tax=Bordetella petrii TaxID=94624 RepID=UPI001E2C8C18|nr:tripartite tricarboxylate transporter substrate binding protein [Bordetella petrii]MCD0504946.1 tripartite tricarboxylate transporter substrate binding protein [Bordetella petrii]